MALLAGLYSKAQDADSSQSLDAVVVTATKFPVKLSETGKTISVVSAEQIGRASGKSLSQVLTEQSGIIVNGANSNPGKDKSVFMRGAGNDYTLILLDGVPVNDPSGAGGAFDLRMFPIEQIERIEILKGSQSTLYGSDALAGVINIITKKKAKGEIGVYGGANYGSYNSFNGSAGITGSTKLLDYNLNYTHSSSDGISEALDTTGKGSFDKDGLLRNSFQANLGFKAGKHLNISPYYRYSYYSGAFDADAFTDGPSTFDALLNNGGAIASYALPKGTITANYGYTYSKRIYATAFGITPFRGRFNTADVYINHALGDYLKVLGGLNYQVYKLLDTSLEKQDPHTSIASPYASLFLQLPLGVNVEAGGRYNHHSEFGGKFTYSASASYLLNRQLKLFANLSTGFKAPSVTDLFGPEFYGSNPELKPEESVNAEAGVQLYGWDKKLQVTATGYQRNIENLIAYVGTKLINIDRQKDHGIEVELALRPDNRWDIRANYNYMTGKLEQARNGKDTSFFNLLRRPKHSVSANVGYRFSEKLFVNISLQSIGERSDLFFEPPSYESRQVELAKYSLLNAYAEYAVLKEKLKVFVDAKNLTDKSFMEVYGYQSMGFNVAGGFRFNL